MPPPPGMTALEIRKKALLLESELNRGLLAAECEQMKREVERLANPVSLFGGIPEWLKWLVPVAGGAMASGMGERKGWLGRILSVAKFAAMVYPLIQKFRQTSSSAHSPAAETTDDPVTP